MSKRLSKAAFLRVALPVLTLGPEDWDTLVSVRAQQDQERKQKAATRKVKALKVTQGAA